MINKICKALSIMLSFCTLTAGAQRNEIKSERIATLQVVAGDDWLSPPVITLGSEDAITISFDDMTHEYHRYAYRIEHCEADWTTSAELFTSDYCEGFNDGNTIEDVKNSINTNILYTHYRLKIPNERCNIKMSGNYRVTIYDDNTSEEVATACFMVVDQRVGLQLGATTNTDIDTNGSHQQIEMKINYAGLKVNNPRLEIKTVVMQNGRWDNAVINAEPQYIMADGLQWTHNKQLIFNGGNEYRKFETLDVSHATMGLESVKWDGKDYHAYVWTDEPRNSYVYDEDADGAFYVRNSDNIENDYISEYVYVHFALKTPPTDNDIYINGVWTNDQFLPKYRMIYNPQNGLYENVLLLKQGYYSYNYLVKNEDGCFSPLQSEGNFCYTENKYQCLVYYKAAGDRTDTLVGYQQIRIN
jgi:hypothetical protein